MPEEWRNGIIVPIHKKGSRLECANYRPITLLSIVYKILSKIINNRLKPHVEEFITDYQCGFKPNRSTTDNIYVVRQSMEKCLEHNIDLHMLFVDFKQVFDSINRNKIYKVFDEFGIHRKITQLTMMTLKDTKAKCVNTGHANGKF